MYFILAAVGSPSRQPSGFDRLDWRLEVKTDHHIPGRSHIAGGIVIAGLAWIVAACGLHPNETGLADGATSREAMTIVPSPEASAASNYFGDEFAVAQRTLQDKPIELTAPTF